MKSNVVSKTVSAFVLASVMVGIGAPSAFAVGEVDSLMLPVEGCPDCNKSYGLIPNPLDAAVQRSTQPNGDKIISVLGISINTTVHPEWKDNGHRVSVDSHHKITVDGKPVPGLKLLHVDAKTGTRQYEFSDSETLELSQGGVTIYPKTTGDALVYAAGKILTPLKSGEKGDISRAIVNTYGASTGVNTTPPDLPGKQWAKKWSNGKAVPTVPVPPAAIAALKIEGKVGRLLSVPTGVPSIGMYVDSLLAAARARAGAAGASSLATHGASSQGHPLPLRLTEQCEFEPGHGASSGDPKIRLTERCASSLSGR